MRLNNICITCIRVVCEKQTLYKNNQRCLIVKHLWRRYILNYLQNSIDDGAEIFSVFINLSSPVNLFIENILILFDFSFAQSRYFPVGSILRSIG